MDNIEKLLKDRPIIVPRYLFNYYLRLGITAEELIVLIFIIDKGDRIVYNPEEIAINLGMDKFKVMEILSSLDEKKIISITLEKNSDGKSEEYISLDLLYKKIVGLIIDNKRKRHWIIVIFLVLLKMSLVDLYLRWNVRLLRDGLMIIFLMS